MRPSWTSLTRRQRSTIGQGANATRSSRWSERWRASAVHARSDALTQWIKGKIPARFHKIGDEIAKFGAIGLINIVVNFAVVNLLWQTAYFSGSEVKAKAVATVIAATSAYFMNRHWTYRDRPKASLRREYTLFFAFNLVGLVIEMAAVYLAKYGLHRSDWLTSTSSPASASRSARCSASGPTAPTSSSWPPRRSSSRSPCPRVPGHGLAASQGRRSRPHRAVSRTPAAAGRHVRRGPERHARRGPKWHARGGPGRQQGARPWPPPPGPRWSRRASPRSPLPPRTRSRQALVPTTTPAGPLGAGPGPEPLSRPADLRPPRSCGGTRPDIRRGGRHRPTAGSTPRGRPRDLGAARRHIAARTAKHPRRVGAGRGGSQHDPVDLSRAGGDQLPESWPGRGSA